MKARGQARLPDPELTAVESGAWIERLADKITRSTLKPLGREGGLAPLFWYENWNTTKTLCG